VSNVGAPIETLMCKQVSYRRKQFVQVSEMAWEKLHAFRAGG
jgi:hypothetical protein